MSLNLIQHPEFGVIRTEVINNDVWFCGKDVCRVLGYENHRRALGMHCREKGVTKMRSPTNGGTQAMVFINEGNLYRLIIKSHLPTAVKFENWVCDEVLPSICKAGFYGVVRQQKPKQLKQESESIEVMRMLRVIDSFLLTGDKQRIAADLGVSRQSVFRILNGRGRSPRILSALYERALKNSRVINGNLYLSPGRAIEKLINPKK